MSFDFSNLIVITTAFVFLGVSIALVVFAIRSALRENQQFEQRLAGSQSGVAATPRSDKPKLLEKLGSHLTLPGPDEIKIIRAQLAEAGFYNGSAVQVFFAVRLLVLFIPQILLILSWSRLSDFLEPMVILFIACLLATISMFGPNWFIRWRKGKRTDQARNGFPDMMDLLVASVEAGLGLDAALMRVTEEVGGRYPVLKVNLDLMNLELRAGQARQTAMQNFATRLNLEEARALSIIIRQSEEMGSSLGVALRTFSSEMRLKRMMRAEEKAMALSAKLTVPLIVFIFPAIMVMLMLPSGVRLAQGMGG